MEPLETVLNDFRRDGGLSPERGVEFFEALVVEESLEARIRALEVINEVGINESLLIPFVQGLRARMLSVKSARRPLFDLCGTGGGPPTFNMSTACSFVVASAGVNVAKHGNRAVTSQCGSSDVLQALGVDLDLEPLESLDNRGICFLFAPRFHPTIASFGPARKAVAGRTIFNVLGPLVNPSTPEIQLVGVWDERLLEPVARTMQALGIRGAVVTGEDGMDEVSPCGATFVQDSELNRYEISPSDFECNCLSLDDIAPGQTLDENATLVREALEIWESERSEALIPTSAFSLKLTGAAHSLAEGAEIAREQIRSGAAREKLREVSGC